MNGTETSHFTLCVIANMKNVSSRGRQVHFGTLIANISVLVENCDARNFECDGLKRRLKSFEHKLGLWPESAIFPMAAILGSDASDLKVLWRRFRMRPNAAKYNVAVQNTIKIYRDYKVIWQ